MSDTQNRPESRNPVSRKWGLPFFAALAILSVISFILPLRPQVSYQEKRELAAFPEFSLEALLSGSYFSDISLWYSDTFPGRERWLTLSQDIASLHGYGDIAITGNLPETMDIPAIPVPTRPDPDQATEPETRPEPSETEEPTDAESGVPETAPEETVPLDIIIDGSSIIQMGDFAFYPVGFSQYVSDLYAQMLTHFSRIAAEKGARVISAPCPTAVGILVPKDYLPSIRSADQEEILAYIHGSASEQVIAVNTVAALMPHKDEYLFFHSDHHWTALAAYYSYRATCEAMGLEPAELDTFEVQDMGIFQGSIYGRVANPRKLGEDIVYAYVPQGNITMTICDGGTYEYEGHMIRDMSNQDYNMKYLCFLESDRAMVHITNADLPEGTSCLIIKDSFGNCLVPYYSMNYHDVYAIDYRKYGAMSLSSFLTRYNIQDVIFAPNMMSTQSQNGVGMLRAHCGLY